MESMPGDKVALAIKSGMSLGPGLVEAGPDGAFYKTYSGQLILKAGNRDHQFLSSNNSPFKIS